jgi:hypothetical protein
VVAFEIIPYAILLFLVIKFCIAYSLVVSSFAVVT